MPATVAHIKSSPRCGDVQIRIEPQVRESRRQEAISAALSTALSAAVGWPLSALLDAIRDANQDAPQTAISNSMGATGNATGPNETDSMACGYAIRHASSGRCTSGAGKGNQRFGLRRQCLGQVVTNVHR